MAAAFTADTDMSPPQESPLTNSGENTDAPLDDGPRPSPPRHQVPKALGGINCNMKVLYCTGIPSISNYKNIYNRIKVFGVVNRIRLTLAKNEESFDCYIVFMSAADAKTAYTSINEDKIEEFRGNAKLYDIRNFSDNDGDYIPKNLKDEKVNLIARKIQLPIWHVVTCRDGKNNILKARDSLEDQIGEINERNLSRYGKNLLIRAEHKSQAKLLSNFTPEEDDIVTSVSPHRSFNTARGVVFNKDLYEYDEKEILERCPDEMLSIRKLKGKNGAIQLTFHSPYLPDYVRIAKVPMTVKKFKQRPTQCHKCFEYGHVNKNCPPERPARCFICSGIHDLVSPCKKDKYCFLCQGAHSPNWRECPVFLMEKEILEIATNDHVSIGAARRRVKPWKERRSYASAASASTSDKTMTPVNPGTSKCPVNPDTNKTSVNPDTGKPHVNLGANKTPVEPAKATRNPEVTASANKTTLVQTKSSKTTGTRPKDPSRSKKDEAKPSILKHQLPASQLEIHDAPQDVPESPVITQIDDVSGSTVEETQSNKALKANKPVDDNMELETTRTKRSRSSSPPVSRVPSIITSNKFSILEREDESSPSPNTPKPSNKSEGTAKDSSTKKSKLLDKASKIKKPKLKALFSKPLLSRSAHLAAGELPKKVRK